jgi:ubiquinone/menaquinone biosynthesis C-methylase UbiE
VLLTGIELSPEMLAIGCRRAERLGRRVDLRLGGAQALELSGESFGAVVCTLGLCTIPDPRRAVAEARRVLRPARRMLLEHVRSPVRAVQVVLAAAAAVERAVWDRPPHPRALDYLPA